MGVIAGRCRHRRRRAGFAAFAVSGEWLSLPLNVLAGVLAGLLRHLSPEREAIWSFSPLFDLSIYHWVRRTIRRSFIDWQTSFFV